MTYPFIPTGPSGVIAYADDSTSTSTEITPGSNGLPNVLFVVNPDAANVVVVNTGLSDLSTDAVVPTSNFNGVGTVVGPLGSAMIRLNTEYVQGNIWVSAAGVSGTGNVYITPGVI